MDFLNAENFVVPEWVMQFVVPGIGALVMLIGAFIVAGWVKKITFKALEKASVEITLTKFFANFARYVVLIVAVVAILGYFGVETASFAAVLAAAGFAIGLAFQGTLSNFSAGVMLLVFRPFKVGDVVTVSGVTGEVEEIELFTTQMNTLDNRRLIVPNGSIFGSTIENITFHDKRRVDVSVGTDYGADLKRTVRFLLQQPRLFRISLRAKALKRIYLDLVVLQLTGKCVFGASLQIILAFVMH